MGSHIRKVALVLAALLLIGLACAPAAAPTPLPTTAPATPVPEKPTPPPAATPVLPTPPPVKPAAVTPTPVPPAKPKFGGKVTVPIQQDPPHFDLHLSESRWGTQTAGMIYPQLIRFQTGPDIPADAKRVVPEVAKEWEIPNNTTYLFRLRSGVTFSKEPPANGRELTAEDVKYSYERVLDPKTASPLAGRLGPVDRIEVVDKYTVRFTLKAPYSPFLAQAAYTMARIFPKEVITQLGDVRRAEAARLVGGGPWLLKKYEKGVKVSYVKNPDYWRKPLPYLDAVDMPIIPDPSTQLAAFKTGQIDLYTDVANKLDVETLRKDPRIRMVEAGGNYDQIFFNLTKKPFDDFRVRKAISMALNRQKVLDLVYFGAGLYASPTRAYLADWSLSQPELKELYNEDPVAAKKLLAEAGYPTGFKLGPIMTYPAKPVVDTSSVIVDQLKANLNIEASVQEVEYAAWFNNQVTGNFTLANGLYSKGYPDPSDYIYAQYHSKGSMNRSRGSDPKLDELLDKQLALVDPAARKKALDEASRYFLKNCLFYAPFIEPAMWHGHYDYVKSYAFNYSWGMYELVETWLDK